VCSPHKNYANALKKKGRPGRVDMIAFADDVLSRISVYCPPDAVGSPVL
jgi:hypothetical protein